MTWVPVVVGELVEHRVAGDSGVGDQGVQPAELPGRLSEHLGDMSPVGHVAAEADDGAAGGGGDAVGGGLGAGLVDVEHGDGESVAGEPLRDRLADAAGAAGHDGAGDAVCCHVPVLRCVVSSSARG